MQPGAEVPPIPLKPVSYGLVTQGVDFATNNAPNRMVDFDISE